ncbi:MAG: hypothetical protein JXB29_04640 [Sedimentisphaerales bacterium]|nr:hypothetical protein [Sedimentisphaerales bacterium]
MENCEYAIDRLEKAIDIIEKGSSIREDSMDMTSSEATTSYSNPEGSKISLKTSDVPNAPHDSKFKDKIINDIYSVIHGDLIQEWEHFLYDIFVEGVIYYVKGYNLGDSAYKLNLKNFKPSIELAEMRDNLSEEFRSSLKGYEELFSQVRKLFKVKENALLKEIQKQVQIRHIFQHNRGEIRRKDLRSTGRNGPDALRSFDDTASCCSKYTAAK